MGYCIIHKWQHIHRNHQGTANTSHSSKITNARIIHDPNAYSGITKARLTLSMNMNIHSIHIRRKSSLRRVFDLILANVSNMDASYNLHMLNDRFMCCNRFLLFCSSSFFCNSCMWCSIVGDSLKCIHAMFWPTLMQMEGRLLTSCAWFDGPKKVLSTLFRPLIFNDSFRFCNRLLQKNCFVTVPFFCLQQLRVMFHSRWFLEMYPCNVVA